MSDFGLLFCRGFRLTEFFAISLINMKSFDTVTRMDEISFLKVFFDLRFKSPPSVQARLHSFVDGILVLTDSAGPHFYFVHFLCNFEGREKSALESCKRPNV